MKRLAVSFALLTIVSCGGEPAGPAAEAPAITTHPTSLTVNEGAAASLSVVATGTAPLTHQWKRDGANIAGATSATYSIASVAASLDGAEFTVTVTNAAGSVTSDAATLTVNARPLITTQPASVTVNEGASATFTVVATGAAPLAYQWKRGGTNIAGATSASYAIESTSGSDDGAQFTVAVSNVAGNVESGVVTLTVNTAPAIVSQPASATVLSGVPATFSVTATGTAPTYQWRRNGVNIAGATRSSYSVGVPLAGDHGATYSVVVSNALGSVTSGDATLTVNITAAVRPTSYANAKAFGQAAMDLPMNSGDNARAFGDFFGNGNRDLFVLPLVYDWNAPESEAEQGPLQFWRWDGAGYVLEPTKVDAPTGCIHARKAVVADFNGDAKADVFVACHGYDKPPFPGEPNVVLLSQPTGVYHAQSVGAAGFYHSASAMDVDNDGDVDVLVTNNFLAKPVFAFRNDGAGNFTVDNTIFAINGGAYFTVEAADVDGDGRTDVLAGGHDWEGANTVVLINDGSSTFAGVTPVTIPAVPNEGVVLDFTVLDADRDGVNEIYVLRTSGGDGTFYLSRTLQKVTWPAIGSTVLHSVRPGDANPWVPFAFPIFDGSQYRVEADDVVYGFNVTLP